MALGGGTFTKTDKVLPGVYINAVTTGLPSSNSERGVVAVPMNWNWGPEDEIVKVDKYNLKDNETYKIFGFPYNSDEMRPIREMFAGADTILFYRANSGGEKAKLEKTVGESTVTVAHAKYSGTRGNDLKLAVVANLDDSDKNYTVNAFMDGRKVFSQMADDVDDLVDNDFITWEKSGWTLEEDAGSSFTDGTDGTASIDDVTAFTEKLQKHHCNIIIAPTSENATKAALINFAKRMREDRGYNTQVVVYNYNSADSEAAISVANTAKDADGYELVYWVGGQEAGTKAGSDLNGTVYSGEYNIDTDYTQTELEGKLANGEFVLHEVNGEICVLKDINTLKTYTEAKGSVFRNNSTIRIIDKISDDVSAVFARFIYGKVKNSPSGRDLLKVSIYDVLNELVTDEAIEPIDVTDIVVEEAKENSVTVEIPVKIFGSIEQVYIVLSIS
ncbi:MAG: phage tail sheath subtilisin-like domain-containing protein [Clostridia bacterium]|nr:phage tail sheath subtilisin-like domain-containing protein [Clostridia bacterium]